MADPTKTYRGHAHPATVVAVRNRRWSEPIPDEFLPRFEAAGLVVDDNDHQVIVYASGHKVGAVWGPAADGTGEWFSYRAGTDPVRVPDRDAGLRHLLVAYPEVASADA
jgi:hypothetical protein